MRSLALLLTLLIAATALAQDSIQYGETIVVVRYELDVRVTDRKGKAIEDLIAADFEVRIGRSKASVESAQWVPRGLVERIPLTAEAERFGVTEADLPPPSESRSIVIFIQTDFGRNRERIIGQMKFNTLADRIIELFGPHDRVAVISHDSHLKFRRDFTFDRQSIRKAIHESIAINTPRPPTPATDGPSLVPLLDPIAMKRTSHAEPALLMIARAMHEIAGPKLMIMAGWGIGDLRRGGVKLKPEWTEAMGILHQDRVPVITLGTGLAGGQLTTGLQATAEATGGVYSGTQDFAAQSIARVEGVLAGHYSLTLRIDDPMPPGQYALDVRVQRKGAKVQAPPYVLNE